MSGKLRILRISTDTYPTILGGGALHAHEMSRLQSEMGHDVTLLTSDHGRYDLPRQEERDGYTVRRYRQLARPMGNSITPGIIPDVWKLQRDYDVVHAHSHLYFSTNIAAIFARFNDTPLVVTNHGLVSQTAPLLVQKVFMKTVAPLTFNSADRVLCYTQIDYERLRELGVTADISIIHNGIDCDTFRPKDGVKDTPQILFVGRLKENKGVCRLIDAFADIADDFPDVNLKIVGTGPLKEQIISKIKEERLEERIKLAGRIPNDEMPELYAESSTFVLPSLNEGLPRTVLEAMACETAVVTSDLPQLEPLVQDAGLTVSKDSPKQLKDAIYQLLSDSDTREQMAKQGRKKVETNYSWSETIHKTTQVYYNLLSK